MPAEANQYQIHTNVWKENKRVKIGPTYTDRLQRLMYIGTILSPFTTSTRFELTYIRILFFGYIRFNVVL